MDQTPPPPGETPPPDALRDGGSCMVCGESLHGVSYQGVCPKCGTPTAVSLKEVCKPSDPVGHVPDEPVLEDTPCSRCGYNLRGLPVQGFCPQCAQKIATSVPGHIELGHPVPDDRPCLMCGYSLKGLPSDGNCPECGTPIERSLRGKLLRYCSPQYLACLHRGVFYAEVGTALKLAATFGFFFVKAGGTDLALQTLMGGFELLISAIMLAGWWMFTTPDQAVAGDEPGARSRRFARVMVIVMAGLEVLLAAFSYLPEFRTQVVAGAGGGGMGAWLVFQMVRSFLEWTVALVGVVALASYLRALSRRVPDRVLTQRATLFRWLIPLMLGLGMPGIFCCPSLIARLAGVVLFFVMVEPWRSAIKAIRKAQEGMPGAEPRQAV